MNEICQDCYKLRPNKRKALEAIFLKSKCKIDNIEKPFLYITLGADQILDVIDLMNVCSFEDIYKIYSYEKLKDIANKAKDSLVSRIFNEWHRNDNYRNKLEIINDTFPFNLKCILNDNINKPKIIFYDIKGWFTNDDSNMFFELLKRKIIIDTDIVIITSCNDKWLGWMPTKEKAKTQYLRYNKGCDKSITDDLTRENIVDLFFDMAIKKYNKFDSDTNGCKHQLTAELIGKYQYKDKKRCTMGLWAYQFCKGTHNGLGIPNSFEESFKSDEADEVVDLFDSL